MVAVPASNWPGRRPSCTAHGENVMLIVYQNETNNLEQFGVPLAEAQGTVERTNLTLLMC